jgi:hypothetical protein
MCYQIHITDSEGGGFVAAKFDDLTEAQKELADLIKAYNHPDLKMVPPYWRTIELYRIERISRTPLGLQEDLQ